MRVRLLVASLGIALAALSSCGQTPPSWLPVPRASCIKPDICKGKGWVVVAVDIAASGGVENAEIVESCPDQSFDQTAVDTVKQWKLKGTDEEESTQIRLCRP
jgi:TonB family protein